MDDDDRYTQITLRIPKALHAKLRETSGARSRSMNAEIIARLELSFESLEERVAALEAEAFTEDGGIENLRHAVSRLEREVEELTGHVVSMSRAIR